ncbi:pantetheine-phosphate adenylyltransferase [Candidatus Woesearchaeota archaeon]|nr:pantetheine-phosphate adenylyltransferase [Candidatus Woesearchaeota archaeon]
MARAMYAFSGDPITYGHIDIIRRAGKIFDEVVVGIGVNPGKNYLFTLEERTEMARKSLAAFSNVRVVSFNGLLVDYAYEQKIPVIIKGVRNDPDFTYEITLHQVGESQKRGIDTFLIPASKDLAHISSSVVKAIQKEQGNVYEYVPLYVKQCLEAKLSGQYTLGITGEIGAGKSYVSTRFEELGKQKGISVHHIDLDHLGHRILSGLQEPLYVEVRDNICSLFGTDVRLPDGSINRKVLGEIVFNDPDRLRQLNELMLKPLMLRLNREMYGKKGLILLNAALLAEASITYLCNNNVLLVTVDKAAQEKRLRDRNLDTLQIDRRIASQYTANEKKAKIEERIAQDGHGMCWMLDNSGTQETIEHAFDIVVRGIGVKW